MEKVVPIYETKEYGRFDPYVYNRPFKLHNYRKIERSMKTYGFSSDFPIVCEKNGDDRLKILFGHHRFFVARDLEIPVKYKISEEEDTVPIVIAEDASKPWENGDFFYTFVKQNYTDYVRAQKFMESTGIKISDALTMLAGYPAGINQKEVLEQCKDGAFTIKDTKHPTNVGNMVQRLRAMGVKYSNDTRLVKALSRAAKLPQFSVDVFINQTYNNYPLMKKQRTWEDFLAVIEKIYNSKQKKKKQIPIQFLVKKDVCS